MINLLQVNPVKCDCCGEMTETFSDKSNWWGKYLLPDEDRICPSCIRDREGYAQGFLENIGFPIELMEV